jgi:uncharacterized RDD family membrane protein YckC
VLDTYRAVETPEGVELGLRVAGPAVRLHAWGIDTVARLVGYGLAAIPLGLLGRVGTGMFFLVLFLGEWLYPVLFEVLRGGATPGKRALGLVVVHDDGTPVGWGASLLRNLLRFADFLPLAYGFGLATMLLHPDFKRLGDLAAGTLVIYRESGDGTVLAVPEAPPMPPAVRLEPDERSAVVAFVERMPLWGEARAAELASLAAPLTGAHGEAGVRHLAGIANWLLGRR